MPGRLAVAEIADCLAKAVAGLDVRHEKQIDVPAHAAGDALLGSRLRAHGHVERDGTLINARRQLAARGHLAQSFGVHSRRHLGAGLFVRCEDRDFRLGNPHVVQHRHGVVQDLGLVGQRCATVMPPSVIKNSFGSVGTS